VSTSWGCWGALVSLAFVMACGKPPLFPTGGQIRASGYCEVYFDGAAQAQDAGKTGKSSHSPAPTLEATYQRLAYDIGGFGTQITLFFEDGVLEHMKIFTGPALNPIPKKYHSTDHEPAFSARGQLPAPVVEGKWHEGPVRVLSRSTGPGKVDTARIRFRGDRLEVDLDGTVARADCAWQ
jgi:hypothetical protein